MLEQNEKINNQPSLWKDDYISNTYEYIAGLNDSSDTYIVINKMDKRKYILKQLKTFDENIYDTLKNEDITGIPKIYEIYHTCVDDEKMLVVAEEYIKGVSLSEYIEKNAITEEKLISIIIKLVDILTRLHSFNPPIIHRDIKPDNIIISDIGKTYLIDFNISRNYTGVKSKDTVIMGTAGFAAPEQFGFGESDARTDIYGLGATIKNIMEKCSISSGKLSGLTDKCTKLAPDERFQSVDEIKAYLNQIVVNKESDVTYEKRSYTLPGFRKKNPMHMLAAIFVYAFLIYCTITYKHDNYISDNKTFELNANRIGFSLGLFAVFLFSCNYLDWQNKIGRLDRKSGIKRVVGVIIIDIFIVLFTALIISILVAVV